MARSSWWRISSANSPRATAKRHFNVRDVIRAAAHDVERPIFYAIAVIIAGYIPIYVLTGPSGRLFQPMADTMSFALLGSLLCTLTLLPVLCSYFLGKHIHEPRLVVYEWVRDRIRIACSAGACAIASSQSPSSSPSSAVRSSSSPSSAASSCRTSMKAHSGCAPPRPTPFPSRKPPNSLPRSAIFCSASPRSPPWPTNWAAPMMAPTPPASSTTSSMSA